jgi:hypothetical protein
MLFGDANRSCLFWGTLKVWGVSIGAYRDRVVVEEWYLGMWSKIQMIRKFGLSVLSKWSSCGAYRQVERGTNMEEIRAMEMPFSNSLDSTMTLRAH